ncbi:transglutaminase domain-containing protein [Eubacteriaceae bacterium ES3]|nr:transglutaminase domain-containing protein [Eubacteriaceae bacterium ES3]
MNKNGRGIKLLLGIGGFLILTLIFSGITLIVLDDSIQVSQVQEIFEPSNETQEKPEEEQLIIDEESIPEYDAYHYLYGQEKDIYWVIAEGLRNYQTKISVSGVDSMEIERIMMAIDNDFPDIFWADTFSYYYDEKTDMVSEVEVTYPYDETEKNRRQSEIDQAYAQYLAGLDPCSDTYQIVKYTYEYVVKNTVYQENTDDQNIYSVFGRKASVCAGYAKAVKYLLDKQGIACSYVSGYVDLQGAHAWNLVRVDGEYYYLDATWGELGVNDNSEPDKNISYDYFCVDTEQLLKTHEIDQTLIYYPEFSATAANYYIHENRRYDLNADSERLRLRNDVTTAFSNGDKYFHFAVMNPGMMEQAKGVLNDTLGGYTYLSDEDMYSFTIMLY